MRHPRPPSLLVRSRISPGNTGVRPPRFGLVRPNAALSLAGAPGPPSFPRANAQIILDGRTYCRVHRPAHWEPVANAWNSPAPALLVRPSFFLSRGLLGLTAAVAVPCASVPRSIIWAKLVTNLG